jgi:hypothetical protein
MTTDIEKLKAFAKAVIRLSWEGCDIGDEVQEEALRYGLLAKTIYDPKTHGESDCAEPGDPYYVFSDQLK